MSTHTTLDPVIEGASRPRPGLRLGLGLVALCGVCYGLVAILGRWAYANGANVITILTVRSLVALAIIWLMVAIARPVLGLPLSKIAGLVCLGVVFVFSALCYFLALERIAVGTAVLIVYLFPAFVVVGAFIFFGERFTRTRLLALLLALTGCILTVDPVQTLSSTRSLDWLGLALALGSALCNAAYALLATRFGRGMPGLTAAAYSMPASALFYLVWSVTAGGFVLDMSWVGWLCCLGMGIFTGLAWILFLVGLPYTGPGQASIAITTEPATAVLLGILLLAEPLSPLKLLGGGLILAAVYLLREKSETAPGPGPGPGPLNPGPRAN